MITLKICQFWVTAAFVAPLLLCCTCARTDFGKCSGGEQTSNDYERMEVLTTVIRDMGENEGGKRSCLLKLSDADYSYVQREFTSNPPAFRYGQA